MIQSRRGVFSLALLALLVLASAIPFSAAAGEIKIKPGKFSHFNVTLPEKIATGESTQITIQAVDSLNNLIGNFNESGKEFQINVSGSAVAAPGNFKSSSFVNGAFSFALSDKTAETVTISIREIYKPIPVLTKDLTVVPNKLSSFAVLAERPIALAGEVFNVKITPKDAFGNKLTDLIPGKNLNLIFKGEAEPKAVSAAIPDLKDGVGSVSLMSEKAGVFEMEVKDLISGSSGTSEKIEIVNGPVSSFKLFTPKEVIAGEPFDFTMVALDRFGNVVTNYSLTGYGVEISSSGKIKPFPSALPAYDFVNGQAKISLRYDMAENISLAIQDANGRFKSASEVVKVTAPVFERFEIVTPDSEVAGQKFKIKITVYNQLNHVIRNYNQVGPDVELNTTGSGTLIPRIIPASEFVNGTAIVEVQYNKSEAFSIIATPIDSGAYKAEAARKAMTTYKPSPDAPAAAKPSAKKEKKAKTKEKEKEKDSSKKKTEAKALKSPLEVTSISLVEPKKKSTLSIHIPNLDGMIKYNAVKETSGDKNYIILRMKPAVNKLEKPVKFESSYVGDIKIEEDKKEKHTLSIKIEMLKPSRFHVTKEKNALNVTLNR
ncbi:MAG: hypothetical protein EPN22_11265 [Nitrospirae bacterium]|nr:MAG: hypothetical protein EPN22_11265 [Nitrospirota bacterium]